MYDVKRFGRPKNDKAAGYRFRLREAGVEVVDVEESREEPQCNGLHGWPIVAWTTKRFTLYLRRVSQAPT